MDFGYPGTPTEFVDEFNVRGIGVPCNIGSDSEVNWLAVIIGASVGGAVVVGACVLACYCWWASHQRNIARMGLREAGSVELKYDASNFNPVLANAPHGV